MSSPNKTTGITAEERRLRSERLHSRLMGICKGFDAGASADVQEMQNELSALEEQLAAKDAEIADLKRDVERLEKEGEARDAKLESLAPHGMCGCSYDKPEDLCWHHSPQITDLKQQVRELGEQLESDRTQVADCLTKARNSIRSREWLTEGRGSYEWNDARWCNEFGAAADEFLKAIEPMAKIAQDWSNCPKSGGEVAKARIDLKRQLAEARKDTERLNWITETGCEVTAHSQDFGDLSKPITKWSVGRNNLHGWFSGLTLREALDAAREGK